MATNTDHLLPWVSGQWRLAESEVAWLRDTELNGAPMLQLRLSVACWRPDASQVWRYWPGVDVRFKLSAPLPASPHSGLGNIVGRVTDGEVRDGLAGPAVGMLTLGTATSGQPSHWAVHLLNGETLRWQTLGWQAWCDAGRAPLEWLHC